MTAAIPLFCGVKRAQKDDSMEESIDRPISIERGGKTAVSGVVVLHPSTQSLTLRRWHRRRRTDAYSGPQQQQVKQDGSQRPQ